MSEDTPTYTVSFKTGPGYDASLIVVRGEDVDELKSNVLALHESLVDAVFETESIIKIAAEVKAPAHGLSVVPTIPNGADPAPAPVAGVVHTCAHGKRTRREGTSAKGPWVGHFCPLPKGSPGQCAAVFEDRA